MCVCACVFIMNRATLNDYSRLSVEEVDVPDRDNVNAPMNWKAAPFRCIYIHTYIHTYTHTCTHTCTHTLLIQICTVCLHLYIHMHIHMRPI